MWPYWLLFLVPAFLAVAKLKQLVPSLSAKRWSLRWNVIFSLLAEMFGFRHEVGGDWGAYLQQLERVGNETFFEVSTGVDPALTLTRKT